MPPTDIAECCMMNRSHPLQVPVGSLKPLYNWASVVETLDAQRITVGGNLGLNPLELKPTHEHVQRALGEDASPFKEKKDSVLSILTNYFAPRGIRLGDKRTTLNLLSMVPTDETESPMSSRRPTHVTNGCQMIR